jgi:hypothetical protein
MSFIGDSRVQIQESREEATGSWVFSKLGAGCSKDGLEQDVPAT